MHRPDLLYQLQQIIAQSRKTPLNELLFIEIVAGLLWNIGSLILITYLTKNVLEQDVIFYDQLTAKTIYSFRSPWLTPMMMAVSILASYLWVTLLSLFLILLMLRQYKKEALLFGFAVAGGGILNILLKLIFQVSRPQIAPLLINDDFSYPSGHAMNSLILCGFLAFYAYHFTRRKAMSILIAFCAVVWIGLVGLSRVYLGVHYPSDVIAGYLTGFWWLVTVLLIDKTLSLRREIKAFKE